jgi:Fe-S oxidoreductase
VAVLLFVRRVRLRYALVRNARPTGRDPVSPDRFGREVTVVLGQRKLLQKLGPGLMHAFIFWGFIVLLPTILEAAVAIVDREATLPWLGNAAWYAFLSDIFATLVAIGVAMAFFIRKVLKPDRFRGSHMQEADRILFSILAIVVTLLLWQASRIALGLADPDPQPVSNLLSALFAGGEGTEVAERILVWSHLLVILGFLVYLPGSKHLHIGTAPINVWLSKDAPSGRLEPNRIDLEAAEEDIRFGVATQKDLSRKQMLDLFTCTECGRCQEVCPAWATGKPLSPKLLVMDLRDRVVAEAAGAVELQPLVPNAVTDQVVWDCVTCGACVRECPVDIEHIDTIVDLRRNLVMAESRFPQEAGAMLRGVENQENPWGQPASARLDWTKDVEVRVLEEGDPAPEVLFWVGCAGAFDERAQQTTRSVVRLLQAAGVDVAVLGPRERCTGDPARRMGHEYLFQMLAEQNVETLNGAGVTKIVASCAHCFNTFANEYPDYGGTYEVVHHTQLLSELIAAGRLQPRSGDGKITYHDACYLGRHNGEFDAPRAVIGGEISEMPRNRERSFCCGAGGARMWMEEESPRINDARFEEATATGAETVATACPYCLVMLDDAAKGKGSDVRVADAATLLAESTLG